VRIRAILTDLDGTLLEPDGSACNEVRSLLADLDQQGVPVCPLTSKTAGELRAILRDLALRAPASFENGAGVLRADGTVELQPAAVLVADLVTVADRLRATTGAPLRTILDLSDRELTALTALQGTALAAARQREATLPLVVEAAWDGVIRAALADLPALRVVRGNRFLHLQGNHDKAGVVSRLIELLPEGSGALVACGDSPNDAGLLAQATVAVIVPGSRGPHPELVRLFPTARVAPRPYGRGWAAAIRDVLAVKAGTPAHDPHDEEP
jgi:mannosyl-3-phosphoglycerate phosphatase